MRSTGGENERQPNQFGERLAKWKMMLEEAPDLGVDPVTRTGGQKDKNGGDEERGIGGGIGGIGGGIGRGI